MQVDPQAIVNWSTFSQARSQLGGGFVRILGYFREDGEKAISRIEDAMHRRDVAALVVPAHTLKSEARQFGADPLSELAEEIELTARRSVEQRAFPDELVPAVSRLRPLYERTVELFDGETNPLAQRRGGAARGAANQAFGRI